MPYVIHSKYRYVESTATRIKYRNVHLTVDLFIEYLCNDGSGRLVNDPDDFRIGDRLYIFGGLTVENR